MLHGLWRRAKGGDVAAARELREWIKQDTEQGATRGEGSVWSTLSRQERQRIRQHLIDHVLGPDPAPSRSMSLVRV